jgi:drug/metabolite transporter (DMT)-like permease
MLNAPIALNGARDRLRSKWKVDPRYVHVVLVSVSLTFSGWHVCAKIALNDGVNPMALALLREALATVLMWCMAVRCEGWQRMDRKHFPRLLLLGFCSFVNVVGAILAIKLLSPTAVALMQPSIPVFAMIISYLCGEEGMSRLKACGVLTAVSGAVWVQNNTVRTQASDNATQDSSDKTGNSNTTAVLGGLVLIAQVCTVLYWIVLSWNRL